jgi:hypothetical protein
LTGARRAGSVGDHLRVLAFTPADPTTLWASYDGGIFKITNAAASWAT